MTLTEQTTLAGFDVIKETLTLPSGAATDSDTASFSVAPDQAFTAIVNEGATDLTAAAAVDVLGSYDDSTFFVVVEDFISAVDAATGVAKYDPVNNTAHPAFPFYKIRLDHAANQAGESVIVSVLLSKA